MTKTAVGNSAATPPKAWSVLIASTFAFTVCFMVWMMFGVIGIPIRQSLHLSETEFGMLAALPVLTGSLVRVTGSGLGCNTWPLCHEGSLVPVPGAAPAIHQAIEFGNRMLTFVVAAAAVAVTVAGMVIDSNGVLSERLASSGPCTTQDVSGSTTARFAGSPTSIGRP